MSLLTACQAVVKETGVGEVPATIISNTDKTAVQLNALAERAADKLAQMDWEKLLREHTITTANGTEGYSLPTDWARYVGSTAWDSTNYWQMRGSLSPSAWQQLKRSLVTVSTQKRFRLRGGQVLVIPTPTAIETLIIEYARNTPWTDSTGVTYRTAATVDTDITVFPERLLKLDMMWRWLKAKGIAYADERDEADREIAKAFATDTPAPVLDFGSRSAMAFPNVPQQITP